MTDDIKPPIVSIQRIFKNQEQNQKSKINKKKKKKRNQIKQTKINSQGSKHDESEIPRVNKTWISKHWHHKCKPQIRTYIYIYIYIIGLVGRVFANGPGDLGSIPGRVIPKTLKMVLDNSLFNTQQYKIRFKGKMKPSRERSRTFPYT